MFQMIDTADTNLPVNLFTPEEDTAETGESDWLAISCCNYAYYNESIDPTWETDVDE